MNKVKKIALGVFIFAASNLWFTACEQPFKAGLGPVVDIRHPTLTLDSPGAGSYIWSAGMPITGTAEDDYILTKVEIRITNHPLDINNVPYLSEYTPVSLNKTKQNEGTWTFLLDTTRFPDGDLKIRLKVTDSVGKSTETDEIAYNIKNEHPAITVSQPYIPQMVPEYPNVAGTVGGSHLNYFVDNNGDGTDLTALPLIVSFPRKVDKKTYLTGSINDDQGIYIGSSDGDRFPPQYRIWRIDSNPSYLPTTAEVPWTAFKSDELVALRGLGNFMFLYELPDDSGNFYGFEIRAQSVDESKTSFHYPRDYYPGVKEFDNLDLVEGDGQYNREFKQENRFVLLYIKAPEATPSVVFYGLEDIFGEIVDSSYGLLDDNKGAHVYVDKPAVNKNGAFTLRLKAEHQEGIESAEVYWQREGSNDRGRFIWDLANGAPPGSTEWDTRPNVGNIVAASNPYSHWGYADRLSLPPSPTINDYNTAPRDFVFTYNHDPAFESNDDDTPNYTRPIAASKDRLPNNVNIHADVRGKSKIQRYEGTNAEWERGKGTASWTDPVWTELSTLEEGVYNIEVYATSRTYTRGPTTPATCIIRLDWRAPIVELITIEGQYGSATANDLENEDFINAYEDLELGDLIVNGVIRPSMLINDSRIVDTGIRIGTEGYYGSEDSGFAREQRFILVSGDYTQLDKLISNNVNWWPPLPDPELPDTDDDYNIIKIPVVDIGADIKVEKHGLVQDGGFKIKTSKIYGTDITEDDTLADGDYWLYVFARDNAFNVGHTVRKIVVIAESDKPRFDFSVGTINEKINVPDYSDDKDPSGNGFAGTLNVWRNVLGMNQEIKVRISDDDSLDLGVEGRHTDDVDLSNIKIEFYKTTQDGDGNVTAVSTPVLLSDQVVKDIFGAQSVEREAAKSVTGTIQQSNLPGGSGGRLPDGIYKIKMSIQDYGPLKLKMNDADDDPLVDTSSAEFWFVVNDNGPEFVPHSATAVFLPEPGNVHAVDLNGTDDNQGIRGTVKDVNGPITLKYSVRYLGREIESDTLSLDATEDSMKLIPSATELASGIWQVDFNIKLKELRGDGTYTVTLTATDRFGRPTTLAPVQYNIDEKGPELSIREWVQTVDRSMFSDDILNKNGLSGISPDNLKIMVNGQVSFIIRATDNTGVKDLRWWLVQAGGSAPVWGADNPSEVTPPTGGKYGYKTNETGSDFSAVTFPLDTRDLDAGEYEFYARAKDTTGNDSDVLGPRTIYIDQKSDDPFFGDIDLANGKTVASGSAVVKGTLYEDDGFDSIRIWMSTNNTAGDTHASNIIADTETGKVTEDPTGRYGFGTPFSSVPNTTTIQRVGKNLNLTINLADHFSDVFTKDGKGFDGVKHYVIEATDNIYGKYQRFYYTFNYDTNPPVIEIEHPSPTETTSFGSVNDLIESGGLKGYIQDANLDTDGGRYYFKYRLNDDYTPRTYYLDDSADMIEETEEGEDTRVSFEITNLANINRILYTDNNKFYDGNNILWLIVRDTTGKETTVSVKFFIDTVGPDIFLNLNEVILKEEDKDDWVANPSRDDAWYEARRELLDSQDVPLIQRESGVFYISGTMVDSSSFVSGSYTHAFDGLPAPEYTGGHSGTSRNGRWQADISGLKDGLHSIQIRAYDVLGNNTVSGNFAFRIVSGQPKVSITGDEHKVFGNKAGQADDAVILTVSGDAESPNLMGASLILRHTSVNSPVTINLVQDTNTWSFPTGAWTTTAEDTIIETLTWELEITRANLIAAGGGSTLIEGTYEIAVVSTDKAGVSSERDENTVWTFTVDKTSPTISFSRLVEDSNPNLTPYDLREVYNGDGILISGKTLTQKTIQLETPVVSGRIQDTGSAITELWRQIRKYDYEDGWLYWNFEYPSGDWTDTETWNEVTPLPDSRDYDWDLKQTTGLENLTDGFYSIRLKAKDSAYIDGNDNWDPNTGTDKDQSTSIGNPVISNFLYFFYAYNPPVVNHVGSTTLFSSANGSVSLAINAIDENRFHTLGVRAEYADTGATVTGTSDTIDAKDENDEWITANTWGHTVKIPFDPDTFKGGSFRIVFTVSDLAGRSTTVRRTITLDNTPPEGAIDEPRLVGTYATYEYSEIQIGGNPVTLSGTSSDLNGIKEIWFHLGYGHSNSGEELKTSFPTPGDMAKYWGDDPDEPATGSAWFKYDSTNNSNTEFPGINFTEMNSSFLFTWKFTMTNEAIAYYAKANTGVNGTEYNKSGGPWMTQPVASDAVPASLYRSGLYNLPLYVRIVDTAGNVHYVARDILIYPNGDYPSTSIINPTAQFSPWTSPRGGQITIEGVANDNQSVRKVIYRVKADNYTASPYNPTDMRWTVTDPVTAQAETVREPYVVIGSRANDPQIGRTLLEDDDEYEKIEAKFGPSFLKGQHWYVANLESQDYGQSVPWSFTLNAGGELIDVIKTRGFLSGPDGEPLADPNPDTNDTVRLWVEIFIFDDSAPKAAEYKNRSLGEGDNPANPQPNVLVFYLKNSSPKISNQRLSKKTVDAKIVSTTGFDDLFGDNAIPSAERVRRGQFAIQASLSGSGNPIDQIHVRLSQESANSGWRPAYNRTVTVPGLDGITLTPVGTAHSAGGYEEFTLRYQFDTTASASTAAFQRAAGRTWVENSGRYTIDVRIRDNQQPPGEDIYSFELGVDNFAPIPETDLGKLTNPKVAGSDMAFQGRMYDEYGITVPRNPPYGGLQKVTAWFTQGNSKDSTNYIRLKNDNTSTATPGTINAWKGRSAKVEFYAGTEEIERITEVTPGDFGEVEYPSNADFVKLISEATAADRDNRMTWQERTNRDAYWSFITDTTKLPDGWITLHYLMEDSVGNVSYHYQQLVVMNNYPQITDIVLYTNNTGEGAVFTTHEGNEAYSEYKVTNGAGTGIYDGGTYLNSGFISKNKVIGFGVKTLGGADVKRNYPLHYRVQYVQRYRIPLTDFNLQAMANGRNDTASLRLTASATETPTSGFINLYTITTVEEGPEKTDTGLSATQWRTLGAKETNPVKGNNFVFQAKSADIQGLSDKGYVYAYRAPLETDPVDRSSIPYPNNLTENPLSLDVLPDHLKFEGVAFDTTIIEKRGSQPGKPDWDGTDDTYDPDTHGNSPDNTSFFIIKVWDTVDGEEDRDTTEYDEDDMLYDAVVVGMNVYITDGKRPVARLYDLNPYTESAVRGNNIGTTNQQTTQRNAANPTAIGTNILRGGLFNVGTEEAPIKSGYIDPRGDSAALNAWFNDPDDGWKQFRPNGYEDVDENAFTGANPAVDQVSGKIILRGWAWDDQLIDEIKITIGSVEKTILQLLYVDKDGVLVPSADQASPPEGSVKRMIWPNTVSPTAPAMAWAVEELHWETGHTVEWAYIWDTESYNTTHTPATGVTVQVTVKDKNGGSTTTNSSSVGTDDITTHTFHNAVTVDIVPYVYGFERQSIYSNTRSRQGWYSFYQGETGITVKGYNLGIAATTIVGLQYAADTVTVPPTPNTTTLTSRPGTATTGPEFDIIASGTPTTLDSGRINISIAGTQIYNHSSNHANKSWNRETDPNISGSDLWINKPHAHIWRTEEGGTIDTGYTYFGQLSTNDTDGLSRPSMALEYTANVGRLTGVWATYGNADSYFARNTTARRMTDSNNNGYGFWTSAAGAIPGEPYLAQDVSFYNGAVANGAVAVSYESDGNPVIYVRDGTNFGTSTAMSSAEQGRTTQRWQNIRVVRSANRSHITSYDSYTRNLQYTSRTGTGAYTAQIYIDGNTPTTGTGGVGASSNAGLYSAIDYDGTGPIVAYYDSANDALRIAYASQENPAAANWTRSYVGSVNSGYGQYVSIKVDKGGGIHLAFYNSKAKTVGYAHATSRTAAFTIVPEVDEVIEGGTWTDISVDNNGNPMIVYGVTSRLGNYDGARMAYRSSGTSTSSTTGILFGTADTMSAWEAVTLPSDYKVKNDRLNIEAWPPSDRANHRAGLTGAAIAAWDTGPGWNAAIGYAGEKTRSGINTFRIGYFYYPAWKGYP